jgi:hypothetical protein
MDAFDPTHPDWRPPPSPHLEVRDTRTAKGRGVYALRHFEAGEIVEICPVKNFAQQSHLVPEHLKLYTFDWTELTGRHFGRALAGGLGGVYNGANPANVRFEADWDRPHPLLRFVAHRTISEGEELTINYSGFRGAPESESNWWFEEHCITMI